MFFIMGLTSTTVCHSAEVPSGSGPETQSASAGRIFSQSRQSANSVQAIRWAGREDRVLIDRDLNGDQRALDELFTRYARVGYRKALAILRSREDAEDAMQDGLFSAFRNLRRFEGRAGFSTWLTRIVINAALMRRRSRGIQRPVSLMHETEEHGQCLIQVLHDPHPTPEAELVERQQREILAHAVYELPERSRRALLHYLDGCSVNKIAEIMGISSGTAKSTLHRARLRVATQLKSSYDRRRTILPVTGAGDQQNAPADRRIGCRPGALPKRFSSPGNSSSNEAVHVPRL